MKNAGKKHQDSFREGCQGGEVSHCATDGEEDLRGEAWRTRRPGKGRGGAVSLATGAERGRSGKAPRQPVPGGGFLGQELL